MEMDERPLSTNPQLEANWCSKATFWWTSEILQLGYKHHLEAKDLYDVLPEDSSIKLANGIGREWEKEVYRWKTGGRPSLIKALFRRYGSHIMAIGLVFFLVEAFRIVQALLLGLIVSYFESGSTLSEREAYIVAGCWTLCYILVVLLDNFAFHKSYYFGLKMRVASTSLIYRKLLSLSYKSLQDTKATDLVHLLATDAQRFDQSCLGLAYIWIAPIETVVVILLLWIYLDLGAISLIGLTLLAILTPVQYLMGKFLSKLRLQLYHLTERRVGVMNEILTGIKTIKVNSWERAFSTVIKAIRRSEWTYVRVMSHIRGVNSAVFFISGKLLMFVTFVSYTLLGGLCTPSTVFTAMALYELLRTSVSLLLPWGIQHYVEVMSAIRNIQEYLLLEEKCAQNLPRGYLIEDSNQFNLPLPENIAVRFRDFSATWVKDKSFTLKNINFSIETGQYAVITGPSGCGKSSILLAIAGELPRLGGFVQSRGKLGLVTQTPCLFPGTIRDNILLGSELEWRRYNRVLHACGVLQDVEEFSNGDLSVIGDNDLQLTNGHKSRICLARAVYQSCEVYLIDDIFSQMEAESALHIFTKCFCGVISTKTIVLVTQNLRFIKAADVIIMLDQGKVVHQGSFDYIQNQGVEIEKMLLTYHDYLELVTRPQEADSDDVSDREQVSCDTHASHLNISRQRSGLDSSYGSSESLDQIILEYDHGTSDTDVTDDEFDVPAIRFRVYLDYLRHNGSTCSCLSFIIFCLIAQAVYVICDWALYSWINSQNSANTTSFLSKQVTESTPFLAIFTFVPEIIRPNNYFYVYVSIFLAFVLCGFLRSVIFSLMTSRIARTLHDNAYNALMRAPLSFFERNPISRILTRFSKDISCVDDSLSPIYFDCIQFALLVLGAGVLIVVVNYWLIFVVIPVCVIFGVATRYYVITARQVKKLELTAKTPIYQHISNTLHGIWIIRSFDVVSRFLRIFDVYEDRYTAASYMYIAIQRWFSLRLDLLGVVLVSLLAFVSVSVKQLVDPGLLGIALAYAINIMGLFQYIMRQSAEVQLQLTSVERLKCQIKVPSEGAILVSPRPAPSWPQYGIVTFEGYTMAASDGYKYLKNVWGCIRAEEKVGILSKDAGSKRAIVSAILRLDKPSKGILRIDGMDTSKIGLQDLRERISHVDGDPILFGGSLRRNLDPFTRYPDASLWNVLEDVGLKGRVEHLPGHLYADMTEYGSHFNQGEKQLLGLARALLLNTKVVIFEEAMSVIDKHTEAVIHYTLDSKFPHKTVIVIARQVYTVISLDRVMILEEGRIKEFDPPHQLLQNHFSLFSRLVNSQPKHRVALLRKLAQDRYENRPYCPPPQSPGGDTSVTCSGRATRHFLPSFQSTRLTGVFSHFSANRFSTNRF